METREHDMPFVLGLTGSIGMGKSTVSSMFTELQVPVFDSDHVVHNLYAPGGAAVPLIEESFPPGVKNKDCGGVNREFLSKCLMEDPSRWKTLESIVHPLVQDEKKKFVAVAAENGLPLVVLDVPLLFESGSYRNCDAVAVVSASPEVQRERVLAREGMTVEKFESIIARQMPDDVKRDRADFVIDTSCTLEETKNHVAALVKALKGRNGSAAHDMILH